MSYRLLHRLLLTLATAVGSLVLAAQGLSVSLPATCQRITSVGDIEPNAYYAIGAQGSMRYLLMRGEVGGSKNSPRIAATALSEAPGEEVSIEDGLLLWEFVPTDDGNYTLRCAQTGESIALYKQKTEFLTLSTSKPMPFAVEEHGGAFRIISQTIKTRPYLEAADWGEGQANTGFSLYSLTGGDSEDIHLYKLATKFSQKQGVATTPTDQCRIVLADADATEGFRPDGTLTALEDVVLGNGEVAPANEQAVFTAQVKSDGTFALQSTTGFLGINLQLSATEELWRVRGGHVVPANDAARFLCYLPADRRFAVMSDEEATAAQAVGVRLLPVGEQPESDLAADGTLRLQGAWSASALAALDCRAAKALDLTALSLPVAATAFGQLPEERNMPIYVGEEECQRVPSSWTFVVIAQNDGTYRLLRPTTLRDRRALYIPHPFSVAAGNLSFAREPLADGGWETLVLPFEANVPQGIVAEELTEASTSQLTFAQTSSISRATPVIFQSKAGGEMLFVAQSGLVSTADVGDGVFFGTFEALTVGSEAERLFLLNADGSSFVLAAAGSGLSPFRAAIRIGGAAASLPLQHTATPVLTISLPNAEEPCFTLDGRRAQLPCQRGVYIVGGKKLIK